MKKGFTLTEILIYIGLFSLIMLVLVSFTFWTIRSYAKARAAREVLVSARRAMETITWYIKTAEGLYGPTTTASQLSLETKHFLPSGEEKSYIDFYLCEQQLCFKKESQAPVVITDPETEILGLSFIIVGISPPSVRINLLANFKNPQNRLEYEALINLNSTVSLRRY